MKSLLAVFLTFSVLLSSLSKSIIYSHYYLNEKYYSEVLCENKTKPEMKCNGHCQLEKELKAEENKDDESINLVKTLNEMTLFFSMHGNMSPVLKPVQIKQLFCYIFPVSQFSVTDIFHPPSLV